MAQAAFIRPLDKLDLNHAGGLDPVQRLHLRRCDAFAPSALLIAIGQVGEGTRFNLVGFNDRPNLLARSRREARPYFPREHQFLTLVIPHENAFERLHSGAIPADDEFLAAPNPYFLPVA